jgi:hypothetical protein
MTDSPQHVVPASVKELQREHCEVEMLGGQQVPDHALMTSISAGGDGTLKR